MLMFPDGFVEDLHDSCVVLCCCPTSKENVINLGVEIVEKIASND